MLPAGFDRFRTSVNAAPGEAAAPDGLSFRVEGLRFRVEVFRFRVLGLGFRVSGLGCRSGKNLSPAGFNFKSPKPISRGPPNPNCWSSTSSRHVVVVGVPKP